MDYKEFFQRWISNPIAMEGKDIHGMGRDGSGLVRRVFVKNGDVYSYGNHYLMCRYRDGIYFVNGLNYSTTTAKQRHALCLELRKAHTVLNFQWTPDASGVLYHLDKTIPDRLSQVLSTSGKGVVEAAELIQKFKGKPYELLEYFVDDTTLTYLKQATKLNTFAEIVDKLSPLPTNSFWDLDDMLAVVRDRSYQPTRLPGRITAFLLGYSKTVQGKKLCAPLKQYLHDLEHYGDTVAAMNLASRDSGRALSATTETL
jgi:hypothetical protein